MLNELAVILESEGIKGHFRLSGSSVNGLGFIDSDIDACFHFADEDGNNDERNESVMKKKWRLDESSFGQE